MHCFTCIAMYSVISSSVCRPVLAWPRPRPPFVCFSLLLCSIRSFKKHKIFQLKQTQSISKYIRACLLFIESGLGRLVRMKKGNAPGWQPRSLLRKGLYTYICCLVHAIIDPNLDRVAFSAADKGSTKMPSLWPLKTLFLSSRFSKCANSPLSGSYEGRKESNATGYQVTNRWPDPGEW